MYFSIIICNSSSIHIECAKDFFSTVVGFTAIIASCNSSSATVSCLVIRNGSTIKVAIRIPKTESAAKTTCKVIAYTTSIKIQFRANSCTNAAAVRSATFRGYSGRTVVVADFSAVHIEQGVVKTHACTLCISRSRIGVVRNLSAVHIEYSAGRCRYCKPFPAVILFIAYIDCPSKIFVNSQHSAVGYFTAIHIEHGSLVFSCPVFLGYPYCRSTSIVDYFIRR